MKKIITLNILTYFCIAIIIINITIQITSISISICIVIIFYEISLTAIMFVPIILKNIPSRLYHHWCFL